MIRECRIILNGTYDLTQEDKGFIDSSNFNRNHYGRWFDSAIYRWIPEDVAKLYGINIDYNYIQIKDADYLSHKVTGYDYPVIGIKCTIFDSTLWDTNKNNDQFTYVEWETPEFFTNETDPKQAQEFLDAILKQAQQYPNFEVIELPEKTVNICRPKRNIHDVDEYVK